MPDQEVCADRTPSLEIELDLPAGEVLVRSETVRYVVEADGGVQLVGSRRPARPWRPRLVIPLAFAERRAVYWLRVQVTFAVERRDDPGRVYRQVATWAFHLRTTPSAASDSVTLRCPD